VPCMEILKAQHTLWRDWKWGGPYWLPLLSGSSYLQYRSASGSAELAGIQTMAVSHADNSISNIRRACFSRTHSGLAVSQNIRQAVMGMHIPGKCSHRHRIYIAAYYCTFTADGCTDYDSFSGFRLFQRPLRRLACSIHSAALLLQCRIFPDLQTGSLMIAHLESSRSVIMT